MKNLSKQMNSKKIKETTIFVSESTVVPQTHEKTVEEKPIETSKAILHELPKDMNSEYFVS